MLASACEEASLDRLRGRVGPVLGGVRTPGRRRGRLEPDLSAEAARCRGPDRLLGHVPEQAGRHARRSCRPGDRRRSGQQALRRRRPGLGVLDPADRRKRAIRSQPRHAVVGHERAVPRERPALPQDARGPRRTSLRADLERPLHGRRRRRVVAAGLAGRRPRARGLLQRAQHLRAGAAVGEPSAANGDAETGAELHGARDPGVEDRDHARVPDRAAPGRPRGPPAGGIVVQDREVAGALGEAGDTRVADRDRLVLGLGELGRPGL